MPKLALAEAAIGAVGEPTAAALSRFEDLGAAALSQCVAGATAIVVEPIAATAIAVSVRRRSGPLRSEPLRPGPTAAAATTPTATTFAPAGTVRTERRDAVGLCKEPKASCDGAGDGAVVHVDEREV
jgi:hypothetical protein